MPILVNGVPEPRIVLLKDGDVIDDFIMRDFQFGNDDDPVYLDFQPDFLRHDLDPDFGGIVDSELRGFRMMLRLFWKFVDGDELQKLRKLLDRRTFDEMRLFPWSVEQPFFFEVMTLADTNIELSYHFLSKHKDFPLTLISRRLLDFVPLADPTFVTWGNISLRFQDLDVDDYDSFLLTVTIATTGTGGSVVVSSGGFLTGSDPTYETDPTTIITLVASGGTFIDYTITGSPVGTDRTLDIRITADVTITANFTV